ncbi:MAG: site-specific integrase [Lachnospiraceae bacterium]|nr:site-specific integrase [Lachnospiraceae bacterium]
MARPKKKPEPNKTIKRDKNIYAQNGYLYVVTSKRMYVDGVKKKKGFWTATHLEDTPDNVKKAVLIRDKLQNNKNAPTVDKNISISDFLDVFLDRKQRMISDTTYSSYFYRAKHIKEFFGDTKVRLINTQMVENFLDNLFTTHKLQVGSVRRIKVLFSAVMKQAIKDGITYENPVDEAVISKRLANECANVKNEYDTFFSFDEILFFLSKIEEHPLYELFYMTLFFGLRREEVLGLKWSAIDFKNKVMAINHTVTKGTTINRNNTTKTDSSNRVLELTDEQIEMLKWLKEREKGYRKDCASEYNDNDYIFKHSDGTLYYPDYPTKAFEKIIKKYPNELPQKITFHGLRTSCVSILVRKNWDVKSIQRYVGHKDIDTTLKIYAKVKAKEAFKGIAETMQELVPMKKYH